MGSLNALGIECLMCNVKILEQRTFKSFLKFLLCLEKYSCGMMGRLLLMFVELWVTFFQTCAELWAKI